MATEVITGEAMQYAFDRIETFSKVQEGRKHSTQMEAVNILLDSLGLNEDLREELAVWLDGFLGVTSGEILLGLLIGLFILQAKEEYDD